MIVPDYILYILLGTSILLNMVLFACYKIWRYRAKKIIRGKLYLQDDEIWSEFQIDLAELHQMDTITLRVVTTESRKE